MSPWLMTLLLVVGWTLFGYQLRKKLRLLAAKSDLRFQWQSQLHLRLRRLAVEGLGQSRLYRYPGAGLAHHAIFWGFIVLLLRTLILWGRGYQPGFHFYWFAPGASAHLSLGDVYATLRELAALLVLCAVAYFAYLRLMCRSSRLTLSREALVILGMIATMMMADLVYDACGSVLASRLPTERDVMDEMAVSPSLRDFIAPFQPNTSLGFSFLVPGSSLLALALQGVSLRALFVLGLGSYYLHVVLVLVFLNLLPVSKHFHILLALPNLFLSPIDEAGPPQPLASSAEALLARVEAAMDAGQLDDAAIGKAKLEHWSFKERLDWFACTECGRCSDHCPAHRTGKSLSPKQLTLSLREQLKREESRLTGRSQAPATELVPQVIEPSVVWACTTCRACEEQCPVGVRYLDTIVGLRRDLVMMRGDAPPELHRAFDGMERNKNPWNFPNRDRLAWTVGLSVPQIKDVERVEYLYWVGCAASFDERNQRVARAFVRLMQQAGITFAILGTEERCTGDSARRAGNELLFLQLAEENIRTLNGYLSEKRFERIVTACPHCLNTLGRDYAGFGGKFDVVHHSVALEQWVREGRLRLDESIPGRATFHDPCTLARFANVVHEPRRLLRQIDGLKVFEPQHHGRQTLCCGGGGAQMWLEEQNSDRMNARRARELVETEAEHVVSACPFCLTMVSDGVKSLTLSSSPVVEDVAEVLLRATRDGTPC